MSTSSSTELRFGTLVFACETPTSAEHLTIVLSSTTDEVTLVWEATHDVSSLPHDQVHVINGPHVTSNPAPNYRGATETPVNATTHHPTAPNRGVTPTHSQENIEVFDVFGTNIEISAGEQLSEGRDPNLGDESCMYTRREVEDLAVQLARRDAEAMSTLQLEELQEFRSSIDHEAFGLISQGRTPRQQWEYFTQRSRDRYHYLRGQNRRLRIAQERLPPPRQPMIVDVEGRRAFIVFLD